MIKSSKFIRMHKRKIQCRLRLHMPRLRAWHKKTKKYQRRNLVFPWKVKQRKWNPNFKTSRANQNNHSNLLEQSISHKIPFRSRILVLIALCSMYKEWTSVLIYKSLQYNNLDPIEIYIQIEQYCQIEIAYAMA